MSLDTWKVPQFRLEEDEVTAGWGTKFNSTLRSSDGIIVIGEISRNMLNVHSNGIVIIKLARNTLYIYIYILFGFDSSFDLKKCSLAYYECEYNRLLHFICK